MLRLAFFVINFAVAVLFAIACVVSVAIPESPFAFLGGVVFFFPVTFYALCEWLAFYRHNASIERKLAYANFGCAAFAAFGVVTNVGEALMSDELPGFRFLFWFSVIGCSIVAYLAASGWCRWRWTR